MENEIKQTYGKMNGSQLMSHLISALNGDAYEEALHIVERIRMTGDSDLIAKAEYVMAVF